MTSAPRDHAHAPKAPATRYLLPVAALVATFAIPLLFGGRQTLSNAANIALPGYAALLGLVGASWIARALKLQLLLRRLKTPATFARSFAISLATDLAFAATPAGLGGYVATVYYLRRAGASGTGAATITAVDQGTDLVFFAIAVPLMTLALSESDATPGMAVAALTATAISIALLATVWFARRRILSLLLAPRPSLARWTLIAKAQRALRTFVVAARNHLSLIAAAGPSIFLKVLALTSIQWLARYAVLWATLMLLHRPVSFALAFLLQVVVLHAALWTGIPAGGGGAELGLTAVLAHWVAPSDMATALVIWRAATLYALLLAGAIAMLILARMPSRAPVAAS